MELGSSTIKGRFIGNIRRSLDKIRWFARGRKLTDSQRECFIFIFIRLESAVAVCARARDACLSCLSLVS